MTRHPGYFLDDFHVIGVHVRVEWNAEERRIYVAGQFIERDVDVFSDLFLSDLNRQIDEIEQALAEIVADPA